MRPDFCCSSEYRPEMAQAEVREDARAKQISRTVSLVALVLCVFFVFNGVTSSSFPKTSNFKHLRISFFQHAQSTPSSYELRPQESEILVDTAAGSVSGGGLLASTCDEITKFEFSGVLKYPLFILWHQLWNVTLFNLALSLILAPSS